jgi:hypothetical protein
MLLPTEKPWKRRRDASDPRLCILSCSLLAVLVCGCAGHRRSEIVLDTVTPESSARAPEERSGLIVYTATDPHAHFDGSSYHMYYSDYEVRSEAGDLIKKVHNDSGTVIEGPVEVKLPAGRYRVHARANGYGWVTVPVVIEAGRVTTVHLDHLAAKESGA